jgi:FlaA1/EpsC-like NDP-sugar epimerase
LRRGVGVEVYEIIGREGDLFAADVQKHEAAIAEAVSGSRFLVIGGAGSIGQAVVREIFKRDPRLLHVVDISENNLVETVRDLRSSLGYTHGEFATFAIDCGSAIFDSFIGNGGGYDYVLNLSALKHVRSEKDPYSLMRMIEVNISNTEKTLDQAEQMRAKKYFCVSTDKAANPANLMGASKRVMELCLLQHSKRITVSTARFANVAFSDGSLLFGFRRRMEKKQPLSAPDDVRRYFVTQEESGELCLLSCLLGGNREVFFPKLDERENCITFSEIAKRFLESMGYEPVQCKSEDEARARVEELRTRRQWPVFFFKSDTTGEKPFEEFFSAGEEIDANRFGGIGVIVRGVPDDEERTLRFKERVSELRAGGKWDRNDIIRIFNETIPELKHKETGKFLDQRM